MKRFFVLTLFPECFPGPLALGVTGRALEKGLLDIEALQIRDFAEGRHHVTDDTPYGGGGGMVMKPEPLVGAIEAARQQMPPGSPVILLSPQGQPLSQKKVHHLAQEPGLILVCGRYEGIDERVRQSFVDQEISVGDYVLSGGEVPALLLIDAVSRLIPEVLGNPDSTVEESFSRPFLEYPQYTRPADFRQEAVPNILLSGDHQRIRRWRLTESLRRTLRRRPELIEPALLTDEEKEILHQLLAEEEASLQQPPLAPISLALLHYPILSKEGEVISTAITNLDIHDGARLAATYGLEAYTLVTPLGEQQALVQRIISHWSRGRAKKKTPTRGVAIRKVDYTADLASVVNNITARHGSSPLLVGTSARPAASQSIAYNDLRRQIQESQRPILLVFGTGWGLAEEALVPPLDAYLPPICGPTDYNHLSVRAAMAVILDRLLGQH